jgi:hypothetical protein
MKGGAEGVSSESGISEREILKKRKYSPVSIQRPESQFRKKVQISWPTITAAIAENTVIPRAVRGFCPCATA